MSKVKMLEQLAVEKNCFNIQCSKCPLFLKCHNGFFPHSLEIGAKIPEQLVNIAKEMLLDSLIEEILTDD